MIEQSIYLRLLGFLYGRITEILKRKELEEDLQLLLSEASKKLIRSYEQLADSLAYAVGSLSVYGFITEAQNPEEKAKKIVNQLEKSYIDFTNAMKETLKIIELNEEDFKQYFSKEDWRTIKMMIESFKEEKPDYNLFVDYFPYIIEKAGESGHLNEIREKQKRFSEALGKELDEFNKKHGLVVFSNYIGEKLFEVDEEVLIENIVKSLIEQFKLIVQGGKRER